MSSKGITSVKEHISGFLLVGVLLAGWLYAITTSWQNGQRLEAQTEQLKEMRGDIADFKRSFISLLLDEDPNKTEIVKELVSDSRALEGINRFKAGQFEAAYAMWVPSAQQGSKDAAFAIEAANAALKQQVSNTSLSQDQRAKARAALAAAPVVEFHVTGFKVRPRK